MAAIQNTLFLVVFGACAIFGCISVMRSTRRIRQPHRYAGALIEWAERPGSSFREDFPTWLAINTHRGTSILLGLVALFLMITRPVESLSPPSWPLLARVLLDPLLVGVVALMGFLWGFMVGGPLAEATGGDRHYAVSDAGVLALGRLMPWDAVAQMSVDQERGALYLWSASLPGTVAYSFHPPAEQRPALLRVLQTHLQAGGAPARSQDRYRFALRMALLCAPFIVAAAILAWMPLTAPALFACAVLIWLLLALGSSLIMRWVYGNRGRPAALISGS